MAPIAGTSGPAAAGQVSQQQNTQNLAQQRVQERTRVQSTNAAGQNNTAPAGQAARPANQQNGPEQIVGKNVNIVV